LHTSTPRAASMGEKDAIGNWEEEKGEKKGPEKKKNKISRAPAGEPNADARKMKKRTVVHIKSSD